MKMPSEIPLRRSITMLLAWIILSACSLPLLGSLATTPATGSNPPTSAATRSAGTPNDPLDRLLTMRSIKFNLTTLRWDGTSLSIDVEIDSAGNLHIKHSLPSMDPAFLPDGFDATLLPTGYELYVVNGKAYRLSDHNSNWMTTSVDENYIQTLSREIHGPDGPAMWLDLLSEGGIHAAGKDTVGGFTADKYAVNSQIAGQSITGTIWFEPQADALVQAELHVPAVLLTDPTNPQQGELKITLNAQKADVPIVTLPRAPAGMQTDTPGTQPTANPSPGSLPQDIPLYPGATGLTIISDEAVEFQTIDKPDQVDQFYQQQMPAQGWTLTSNINQGGTIGQLWQKDNRVASISITPQGETAFVMIAFTNS